MFCLIWRNINMFRSIYFAKMKGILKTQGWCIITKSYSLLNHLQFYVRDEVEYIIYFWFALHSWIHFYKGKVPISQNIFYF